MGRDAIARSKAVLLDCHSRCRMVLVVVMAVASLSIVAPVASATSSFYWYGEGNSTCWQAGQLGAPSTACDFVGAGYLPTPGGHTGGLEHMAEGGIGTDITLSPSGDYCNYYRLGGVLNSQDSTNEGSTTGLSMPTPYSSYQEGDKTANASNACQANGSYWGQAVRGPSGKGCTETCGMHHYVSFKSQGTSDRPWSSVFANRRLYCPQKQGYIPLLIPVNPMVAGDMFALSWKILHSMVCSSTVSKSGGQLTTRSPNGQRRERENAAVVLGLWSTHIFGPVRSTLPRCQVRLIPLKWDQRARGISKQRSPRPTS